jgi:uncharacterized membrane protein YtjA (UPF0391 family)
MLRWALGFLILASLAAYVGFTGGPSTARDAARTLFLVFVILAAGSFVLSLLGKKRMF